MSSYRYRKTSHVLTLIFCALAFSAGCSASSEFMLPAKSPVSLAPPKDRALLVFLRPSSYGSAVAFRVIDGRGRFVGDSLVGNHFAVPMAPGTHMIFAWGENVAALQANLAANKTYYIVVRPYMGVWSARVNLTALAPRSEDWPKLKDWLNSSEAMNVDFVRGQADLDAEKQDVMEKIAEGTQEWKAQTPEERAIRVLLPEDGV